MSPFIQTIPTAAGEFQAQFGAPPTGHDAKAECEKWQRLCDKLLTEREFLRVELEKERLDRICKEFIPTLTMDEVYAQIDRETTLEQLIDDLQKELETEK